MYWYGLKILWLLLAATNMYKCFSIIVNVVEKLIYFSNSTQIVKLVY